MRAASTAGPAGIRAVAPKNVTSTPWRVRSRSASRQTAPPAVIRSASTSVGGRSPPESASTSMPRDSRKATNASNSDAGSRRSATVVNGTPCCTSQSPAASQLPVCGRAKTTPRPPARAASSTARPVTSVRATTSAGGRCCSRNTSRQ